MGNTKPIHTAAAAVAGVALVLVALLAAHLWGSPTGTAPTTIPEVPTFRGIPLGVSPLEQYLPLCPKKIRSLSSADRARASCWWLQWPGQSNSMIVLFFVDKLGKLLGNQAFGQLSDGKLAFITFEFPLDGFGEIDTLFHAKYGDHPVSHEEPWQSKGGVQTTAQVRIWIWNGLAIQLKAPAKDIDHGRAVIAMQGFLDEDQKQHVDDLRKGLGDL